MADILLAALALMLMLEGVLPLLSPMRWRSVFAKVLAMSDGQIRFIGLSSMIAGLLMLWILLP